MKVVILAGGLGSRLSEETQSRPKPMVTVGDRPILWHIMKIYASHGMTDFIICCGYKGYVIKEYFANYFLHSSDVTFDLASNRMEVHQRYAEPWRVTLIDTGEHSMTGGRLKRTAHLLRDEEAFCFTYGDGVGDVNITELVRFHKDHGRLATVTGVQPPGRYGVLKFAHDESSVIGFTEKPQDSASWINGGYFVVSPRVLDYIDDDAMPWESAPMERLAAEGELQTYRHNGFWQPMDTLRDKHQLDAIWASGNAPWKTWK
jgi:glucose-1-phosphate cytidylyltransferase